MRPSESIVPLLALVLAVPGGTAAQAPELTNGFGMDFVLVEPGSMVVARFAPTCPDPAAAGEADSDPRTRWTSEDYRRCAEIVQRQERDGFTVTIDEPFYIGRYEVTQEQWERVMGSNPSHFQGERIPGETSRHPVESVTWDDAQRFVQRLNALDSTAVYRLPTEFEWEYAARAGADLPPSWSEVRESAWIADVDRGTTHEVGLKEPNAWGLYDTLGNVWEWVQDPYNGELFPDPVPERGGDVRVLRGGSFTSDVKNATWATHAGGPGNGWDVGFRVVREAPD